SMDESELVRGIVVDKEVSHPQMPKQVKNARIALLNAKLEIEKTEFDAKININSPDQMKLFLDEEESMLREMTDKVVKSGANVIFCERNRRPCTPLPIKEEHHGRQERQQQRHGENSESHRGSDPREYEGYQCRLSGRGEARGGSEDWG